MRNEKLNGEVKEKMMRDGSREFETEGVRERWWLGVSACIHFINPMQICIPDGLNQALNLRRSITSLQYPPNGIVR